DVVVLQAVGRTDRQLQLVHLLQQGRVEGQLGLAVRLLDSLGRLIEGDEDLQLVLQDARGVGHGVNRRDGAVGFNFQDQLVVVQRLALTGRLDAIGYALRRRIQGVDGDQADRSVFRAVQFGGDV